MKFWERYFDSFETKDRESEGGMAALSLALLIPTFILWVLWHLVAWIVRLGRRSS